MTYLWSCGWNNSFYMVCVWMTSVMLAASLAVLGLYLWTYEHVGVVCNCVCETSEVVLTAARIRALQLLLLKEPTPPPLDLPLAWSLLLRSGATGTTSSQKRSVWLSSHLLPPHPPLIQLFVSFFKLAPGHLHADAESPAWPTWQW